MESPFREGPVTGARYPEPGDGPVIILDHYDNTASGGTMDTTEVLAAVLAAELEDVAVFGFYDPAKRGGPPIATGGRYDMVTKALGKAVPAVGGVIRPGVITDLEGRTC